MDELIRARRRARNVCTLLLLQIATGCTSWHRLPGVGLARAESETLGHAKVFLRDGTEVELDNAKIRPDSIIGLDLDTHARLALARSEIAAVDTRQPDGAKTFLVGELVPVSMFLLWVAAVIVALSTEGT